jgi:hypothetical protein
MSLSGRPSTNLLVRASLFQACGNSDVGTYSVGRSTKEEDPFRTAGLATQG